jgi:hypothetical protein
LLRLSASAAFLLAIAAALLVQGASLIYLRRNTSIFGTSKKA